MDKQPNCEMNDVATIATVLAVSTLAVSISCSVPAESQQSTTLEQIEASDGVDVLLAEIDQRGCTVDLDGANVTETPWPGVVFIEANAPCDDTASVRNASMNALIALSVETVILGAAMPAPEEQSELSVFVRYFLGKTETMTYRQFIDSSLEPEEMYRIIEDIVGPPGSGDMDGLSTGRSKLSAARSIGQETSAGASELAEGNICETTGWERTQADCLRCLGCEETRQEESCSGGLFGIGNFVVHDSCWATVSNDEIFRRCNQYGACPLICDGPWDAVDIDISNVKWDFSFTVPDVSVEVLSGDDECRDHHEGFLETHEVKASLFTFEKDDWKCEEGWVDVDGYREVGLCVQNGVVPQWYLYLP